MMINRSILQAAQDIARDPFKCVYGKDTGRMTAPRIGPDPDLLLRMTVSSKCVTSNPAATVIMSPENFRFTPDEETTALVDIKALGPAKGNAVQEKYYLEYRPHEHYELREHPGGISGDIVRSSCSRCGFLQGDDWEQVKSEVDDIWKQVRWKKIGKARAQQMQDDLLSQYFE